MLDGIRQNKSEGEIVDSIYSKDKLAFLKSVAEENKSVGKRFSRDLKSMAFIRDALERSLRCKICNSRMHKKSISVDHKMRKADGGAGSLDNAQLTHPYCNTGYKESLNAKTNRDKEKS